MFLKEPNCIYIPTASPQNKPTCRHFLLREIVASNHHSLHGRRRCCYYSPTVFTRLANFCRRTCPLGVLVCCYSHIRVNIRAFDNVDLRCTLLFDYLHRRNSLVWFCRWLRFGFFRWLEFWLGLGLFLWFWFWFNRYNRFCLRKREKVIIDILRRFQEAEEFSESWKIRNACPYLYSCII